MITRPAPAGRSRKRPLPRRRVNNDYVRGVTAYKSPVGTDKIMRLHACLIRAREGARPDCTLEASIVPLVAPELDSSRGLVGPRRERPSGGKGEPKPLYKFGLRDVEDRLLRDDPALGQPFRAEGRGPPAQAKAKAAYSLAS